MGKNWGFSNEYQQLILRNDDNHKWHDQLLGINTHMVSKVLSCLDIQRDVQNFPLLVTICFTSFFTSTSLIAINTTCFSLILDQLSMNGILFLHLGINHHSPVNLFDAALTFLAFSSNNMSSSFLIFARTFAVISHATYLFMMDASHSILDNVM